MSEVKPHERTLVTTGMALSVRSSLGGAWTVIPGGSTFWYSRDENGVETFEFDPCGGNTRGGSGCSCDPPFGTRP